MRAKRKGYLPRVTAIIKVAVGQKPAQVFTFLNANSPLGKTFGKSTKSDDQQSAHWQAAPPGTFGRSFHVLASFVAYRNVLVLVRSSISARPFMTPRTWPKSFGYSSQPRDHCIRTSFMPVSAFRQSAAGICPTHTISAILCPF
jgi:hypothetical protein